MIEYLNIEKLKSHPNNPRKDLGDLTELADSIKENGVLQNLTVNDNDDGTYTVVIGHRRLAALKMLEIETAPCVVRKMDEATQVSMMLLENMQRNDLTPYEQAQGFQMCLDFGMDEELLKKKTGFSKTTIKHRLNLLKLNQDKFLKGVEKGATLQDYIDLEKIEDEKVKDKILDYIGTNDFRYKLNNELMIQENVKETKKFINMLKEYMDEVEHAPEGYSYLTYLYGAANFVNFKIPEDIDKRKYIFINHREYSIKIYKEILENEKSKVIEKSDPKPLTQTDLNIEEIKKKTFTAYQTRLEFAKHTFKTNTFASTNIILFKYAFLLISNNIVSFYSNTDEIFEKITSLNIDETESKKDLIFKSFTNSYKVLFALIYASLENEMDNITVNNWKYSDDYGKFDSSSKEEIETLYDFLELFDYQASEEEKAIMFGTHELYVKGE
ncbi:MAG: ParB/RepB/Spo0J family partition protein [Carnobacterium sp.]